MFSHLLLIHLYIGDKVLLIGFPSRFKINKYIAYDIVFFLPCRFLEETHKDHYKVFNFCENNSYTHPKLENRVSHYPIEKHNVPLLDLIDTFLNDIVCKTISILKDVDIRCEVIDPWISSVGNVIVMLWRRHFEWNFISLSLEKRQCRFSKESEMKFHSKCITDHRTVVV